VKTSIEIDEKVLEQARKILGTDTIRETVNESLRLVVRQRQLQEVVDMFGTLDMDLTPQKLRKMRYHRTRDESR